MSENVKLESFLPNPLTVSIVGAGFKGGQPISGCEAGPEAIRASNLIPSIDEVGWKSKDNGNLSFRMIENDTPSKTGVKNPRTVGEANNTIFNHVSKQALDGKLCLTLGGDHSLAIGTISGVNKAYKNDLRVIWVDAHGDINTPETSPTGNIHGMPVAFLMGLVKEEVPGFEWLKELHSSGTGPSLTPDRIVYIGLRDVDSGERSILRQQGIKVFSMTEIDKYGIGKVMEMTMKHLSPDNDKPIHLSFDVDAIDPQIVSSTGTRVKGGLSYREARQICESVAETGKLVGLDIVEVNPSIGSQENVKETAAVAVELIKTSLGMKLW